MDIQPFKPEEKPYMFSQSRTLKAHSGSIGHLRGDFGSGKEFYTSWEDHQPEKNTPEFRRELDTVINTLRAGKDGILHDLNSMSQYAYLHQENCMIGEFGRPFGIRIDTEKYAFLLRCTPLLGNYNFYCCCYERDVLDRHMERASRGIRFITPFYEEKFRLPDDEQITVRFPDGRTQTHRCRYIDETHFEVDGGREIFHICQYAEKLEAARAVCEPTAKTPKTKEHER